MSFYFDEMPLVDVSYLLVHPVARNKNIVGSIFFNKNFLLDS